MAKFDRIVLVGLSGGGKSTVGRMAADLTGWTFVDTDAEIAARCAMSVPEIFATRGEDAFRAMERETLGSALGRREVVVATGGGAVVDDAVWAADWLGAPDTLTVWLDADEAVLLERLRDQQALHSDETVRPLLQTDDPLASLRRMRETRADHYARARVTVPVGAMEPEAVARLIAGAAGRLPFDQVDLHLTNAESRIRIGHSSRELLTEAVRERWPTARRVWVVTDEDVAGHHLEPVVSALDGAGIDSRAITVPAGEGSKSLAGLAAVHDAMLGGGVERSDVVVALGGGMIGDLAGFAAATTLRGIGLVQMPTTLLAMVDSSVGGKTGINHAAGKNLIGAFYQPSEVLIDPAFLDTLPAREFRSGWAEIIKHGLIEPSTPAGASGLSDLIAANASGLAARDGASSHPLLVAIIARNVAIKASVVRADERESGLRAILNLGHTFGHAVEASDYRLLHGEAVSVGLHGAMRLGAELGRVPHEAADAVRGVLTAFGLPVSADVSPERVQALMSSDKKRTAGQQTWVLPRAGGGVEAVIGVPEAAVRAALARIVLSSPAG